MRLESQYPKVSELGVRVEWLRRPDTELKFKANLDSKANIGGENLRYKIVFAFLTVISIRIKNKFHQDSLSIYVSLCQHNVKQNMC